jgi:hypothetical protein
VTRKQLPFFIGFFVLMFGAMACACLGSGVGISGFTATANAALTQASSAATQGSSLSGTASAAGSSAEATANAEATQAVATANAAGGSTSGQATATTASGSEPTAAATTSGSGSTGGASGGPSDIPVVQGDNTILLVNAQLVSYQTKTDFATTVKFYKDQMPKNGWTQDTSTSIETTNASVLAYTKDTRKANVSVTKDPTSGQTMVLITIQ